MKAKIFIFCNSCDTRNEWHSIAALSEDGHFLAGHVCSHHGFIRHDMGINSDWKRDKYDAHYPGGYEMVLVERDEVRTHPGIQAAYEAHLKLGEEAGVITGYRDGED